MTEPGDRRTAAVVLQDIDARLHDGKVVAVDELLRRLRQSIYPSADLPPQKLQPRFVRYRAIGIYEAVRAVMRLARVVVRIAGAAANHPNGDEESDGRPSGARRDDRSYRGVVIVWTSHPT